MSKKVTYETLISIDHLTIALEKIKNKASPGLDGMTKSKFTEDKIKTLHRELKQQKYQPKPVKRIEISKPNGKGVRPLGIASQRDKVVQAAVLLKLEPILEKIFSPNSFGFRTGKNCHDALHRIKYYWQNTIWLINIDIQNYFESINHKILLKELHKHCDQATIELISKMLRVGYVNLVTNQTVEKAEGGTPQGSLISPILSNFYLHALDLFVENLSKVWNTGDERRFLKSYQQRKNLTEDERKMLALFPELKPAIAKIKHNRWVIQGKPSRDPHDVNFRRLHYVRYADDFLLGFSGTKNEAEGIKEEIVSFLENERKLAVNKQKSGLSHSKERNILFLGCYIRYMPNKIVSGKTKTKSNEDGITQLKSQAINNASLKAPIDRILERIAERKYAVKKENGTFRATSRRALINLEERDIVNRYSSIIRGLLRYYSFVNQRSDLWPVVSIYRKSCALTLADKLKLRTAAQVFKKFGPNLSIKDIAGREVTKLYYPESLKTKVDFKRGQANIDNSCIDGL